MVTRAKQAIKCSMVDLVVFQACFMVCLLVEVKSFAFLQQLCRCVRLINEYLVYFSIYRATCVVSICFCSCVEWPVGALDAFFSVAIVFNCSASFMCILWWVGMPKQTALFHFSRADFPQ